jgi:Ion channel
VVIWNVTRQQYAFLRIDGLSVETRDFGLFCLVWRKALLELHASLRGIRDKDPVGDRVIQKGKRALDGIFDRNFMFWWPLFAGILGWFLVSALILQKAEAWPSYSEAVWVTWTTMTTMGWGNASLQTVLGKLLVSVNALIGLVLIGSVVWLFTTFLGRC